MGSRSRCSGAAPSIIRVEAYRCRRGKAFGGRFAVASGSLRRAGRRGVWLCFDVDSSGIARTAAAQFIAYWSGIVFLVEELLPLVIGRPPAVATVIPASDPRIGSGSKCNAIGHCALPSTQKGCCSVPCKIPTLAPRHRTVWAKKGHMCGLGSGFLPSGRT